MRIDYLESRIETMEKMIKFFDEFLNLKEQEKDRETEHHIYAHINNLNNVFCRIDMLEKRVRVLECQNEEKDKEIEDKEKQITHYENTQKIMENKINEMNNINQIKNNEFSNLLMGMQKNIEFLNNKCNSFENNLHYLSNDIQDKMTKLSDLVEVSNKNIQLFNERKSLESNDKGYEDNVKITSSTHNNDPDFQTFDERYIKKKEFNDSLIISQEKLKEIEDILHLLKEKEQQINKLVDDFEKYIEIIQQKTSEEIENKLININVEHENKINEVLNILQEINKITEENEFNINEQKENIRKIDNDYVNVIKIVAKQTEKLSQIDYLLDEFNKLKQTFVEITA